MKFQTLEEENNEEKKKYGRQLQELKQEMVIYNSS